MEINNEQLKKLFDLSGLDADVLSATTDDKIGGAHV